MRHRSTITTLVCIATVSTPAIAQSAQRWSIQASGIAVGVFGNAYDGLATGYGGELQVRVTPSLWSWGAGVQTSSHSLKDISGQSVSLTGVFLEPRRVFDVGSAKYAPYLSARFSYLQQSASFDLGLAGVRRNAPPVALRTGGASGAALAVRAAAGNTEISASGFQGNIGGGVLAKLTPRVNLDLGVTVGAIRFGDATLTINGQKQGAFDGTSGTGQNVVVRAGLAIGLGKGAAAKPAPAPAPAARPRR